MPRTPDPRDLRRPGRRLQVRRLARAVHRDHGVGPPVQRGLQDVGSHVAAAAEDDDLV
jgi:hypothetical protein